MSLSKQIFQVATDKHLKDFSTVFTNDFIESCEVQLASAITVFYNLSPGFENMHRT